jgi:hypothetical protein
MADGPHPGGLVIAADLLTVQQPADKTGETPATPAALPPRLNVGVSAPQR